jgi:hypothetical protein
MTSATLVFTVSLEMDESLELDESLEPAVASVADTWLTGIIISIAKAAGENALIAAFIMIYLLCLFDWLKVKS